MNIDKQILKIINKANVDCGMLIDEKVAFQIKQSILKAIMEKMPKKIQKLPSGNYSEDYVDNYIRTEVSRNKTIDEFESVIKELLSEAKK